MWSAALFAGALLQLGATWLLGIAALLMLSCVLLARAVCQPLSAVENGLNLIREQDFASRLRPTGQADADRLVSLFNRMMDSMKAERLKTLEQERLLSSLIECVPSGIAICNLDGDIEQTNTAFRQLDSAELRDALAKLSDDESTTLRLGSSQIFRCQRLWFMDSGFRRRFYIVSPMTDEIVKAETQIFQKMVRTIGHEVNNAMGSTISVLDTLAGAYDADCIEYQAIDSCSVSCRRLVDFVKRYATLVKLPAPDLQRVDLNVFLESLQPSLRSLLPEGIALKTIPSPKPSTVSLDPSLMERVMVNIVKNAAESIGSEGEIIIKIEAGTLTITDNGPGIGADIADKLFTPFFSTKHPDRGLGLMLIADILRAHKARFSLSTTRGLTDFRITF